MTNSATTIIKVSRRHRAGWHVYTCVDLPGLYVASKDDKAAYNDVPTAIKMLLKLDHGVDVSVHHAIDYTTFIAQLEMSQKAADAIKDRTQEMMTSKQTTLFYTIGSSPDDFAAGCH